MKSFLEYVAEDILSKWGTNLSHITVVFPNKRASLFLNEHLVRLAGKPIWSPAYITISDLFRQYSKRKVADPIKLVCELHKSYTAQTGIDETLDHFYGWGQLLLADFDDIDKQMADADKVLANITDLHEMDDNSFLTDEQREVLRRFFSNFTDEHNSELRQRFLRLWSKLKTIYHDFNDRLAAQGLAYEGALYREVVRALTDNTDSTDASHTQSVKSEKPVENLLFIGFNVLLQVEQQLFSILKKAGKARFYWDFDDYYMPHTTHPNKSHSALPTHEAGYFISQYLADFPNELDIRNESIYSNFCRQKRLCFVSASTENIQARYAAMWLKEDRRRIDDGRETAVVLCNESLLPTIIHCLPSEVSDVNVTTGYPLSQSPVASLINMLVALRRDGYDQKNGTFRFRQVRTLLRHPYIVAASPQATALMKQITDEKIFRPTPQQLSVDTLTTLIFSGERCEVRGEKSPQATVAQETLTWLCEAVKSLTSHLSALTPFQTESIFRTFTLLNRLLNLTRDGDLLTDITTLGRLINQLIQTTTVPFHGEPAEGLQVMGILETRNLDFRHVLILSAQEGNMPRGAADTSFIPYSLRRAYGLTTPEHKVAIYSYYFHRLLQRADDVTIVYNNATNDGQKGEMSRFLLQLMVEYPHTIIKLSLQGHISHQQHEPQPVSNTFPQLLSSPQPSRLTSDTSDFSPRTTILTPTAINRYLRCPLQFHYYYVCGLRELDDPDCDTIDNRIFGNIFHEAARSLYSRMMEKSAYIMAADIDNLLKTPAVIERAVDEAFQLELFNSKHSPHSSHLNLGGLALINRQVIIHYLRQLLALDRKLTPFTILALEEEETHPLPFSISGGSGILGNNNNMDEVSSLLPHREGLGVNLLIGGRVDRMDMVKDAEGRDIIRVIDYKTGAHRLKPLADVDAVFSQESLKDHSDYYLQAMFYSLIVAKKHPDTPVAPALLFIQHAGAEGYNPILQLGRDPIIDIRTHSERFTELLHDVINRMLNPDIPLVPTEDRERCRNCPYHQLCYY